MTVLQYLDSKGINYTLDGNNASGPCPVCKVDEGNWGINIESGLWNCFRASKCGAKGNLKTLRRLFGDPPEQEVKEAKTITADEYGADEVVDVAAKTVKKQEAIPDIEAAHAKLLENNEVMNWLNDERGIGIETVQLMKLGLGLRRFIKDDKTAYPALMFPYFADGICVGVKYRSLPPLDKDFRFTANREVGLYNQDAIKSGMESLQLMEGESDTLSVLQAGFKNVVGVPGCEGKKVTWDHLLKVPKKKYLIFDNDVAGQKGALAFATRFGINEFHNVLIPKLELDLPVTDKHGEVRTTIKDANEFFMLGKTAEDWQELLDHAKAFDIEGVTSIDSAFDEIEDRFRSTGSLAPKYEFKWESVTRKAKGINDGDLIVILAAAKIGKTTFCLNQADFMTEKYGSVCHFSCLEMDAVDLTKKLAALVLLKDEDSLTLADIAQAKAIYRERGNKFNFSREHPNTLDEYLNGLRAIKRRYDNDLFILDNFQIIVDLTIGRGNTNNRPSYMSQVSKSLKALAGELKLPIILISQPKQVQDDKMTGVNDSEGSSTLTKDADLFFTLNRNPEVKMTLQQAQNVGNLETDKSHSENMYVDVGLSRRSPGGMVTLKIDGAKSLIREYSDEETKANTKQGMIAGMKVTDENEQAEAAAAGI